MRWVFIRNAVGIAGASAVRPYGAVSVTNPISPCRDESSSAGAR